GEVGGDGIGALLLEGVDGPDERAAGDDDARRNAGEGGAAEDLLPPSLERPKVAGFGPGKLVRDRVELELEEGGEVLGKGPAELDHRRCGGEERERGDMGAPRGSAQRAPHPARTSV